MSKGFDSFTDARQLPGSARHEKITNAIGYYVESDSIHRGLVKLCQKLAALDLDTLAKVHLWFGYAPHLRKLTVWAGFITDYASIPRALWGILAPKDIRRPAVHHDAGYRLILHLRKLGLVCRSEFRALRKLFDRLFREQMQHVQPDIAEWKKRAAYRSVRAFGGFSRANSYEHLRPQPSTYL